MTEIIAWPPTYTVKRYRLARHVKLRASRADGLIISTPMRFSLKHIPQILEENRDWIIERLQELQAQPIVAVPNTFELPALGITFVNSKNNKELLIRALKKIAREFLSNELQTISTECNLPFTTLSIRDQKTMWGSCSPNSAISLNYKLIFLPYTLARHVIVHELCHTMHHNHSTRFWQLVAKHDANWREHKRQLRQAEKLIPKWL